MKLWDLTHPSYPIHTYEPHIAAILSSSAHPTDDALLLTASRNYYVIRCACCFVRVVILAISSYLIACRCYSMLLYVWIYFVTT